MNQLPLALPPASGELDLRPHTYTPITYCRRCGTVVAEIEAIKTHTHSFCTISCRAAHQEHDQ